MTWTDLVPFLAQGGVMSVLGYIGYRLHADAVAAERRRAEDHKEAATQWREVASERQRQVDILLGRKDRS